MQPSTRQPATAGATPDRSSGAPTHDAAVPGWRLNFVAGFVPLFAGLTMLVSTWLGVARANSAWWTGIGTLDFSYSSLSRAGLDAPAWVQLTG
ncbi:MAG TPA: hypothetical protein VLL82_02430, partial [Mycobacterium sp.]|nr:hypothetical protein [Mycobacterium sp.]